MVEPGRLIDANKALKRYQRKLARLIDNGEDRFSDKCMEIRAIMSAIENEPTAITRNSGASDLIDRKKLLREIDEHVVHSERHMWSVPSSAGCPISELAMEVIEDQPTVEAVEVIHGYDKWREFKENHCEFWCSECEFWLFEVYSGSDDGDFNYCPNCGAKLDVIKAKVEEVRDE